MALACLYLLSLPSPAVPAFADKKVSKPDDQTADAVKAQVEDTKKQLDVPLQKFVHHKANIEKIAKKLQESVDSLDVSYNRLSNIPDNRKLAKKLAKNINEASMALHEARANLSPLLQPFEKTGNAICAGMS
eukprot:GHVU01126799.1.p1 GENE.GHVU01126799.1~~GHVU01126799.1.p1  ORF type:complete len:132 (-),score=21.69 GHVU01126799.1:2553-2948(-)